VLPSSRSDVTLKEQPTLTDTPNVSFIEVKSHGDPETFRNLSQQLSTINHSEIEKDVFVVAIHGKSSHQAIWRYLDLQNSNRNLECVADEVLQQGETYCVPENGDLTQCLKGLLVILRKL
jgi:hypothetical protein